MTYRPHPAARAAAAQPYTYTDGQGHELTLSAITDAVRAPYVRVGGENTAVGGAVASVWLPLDQAHALDRALSDRTPYEAADHMGDTLTVTVAEDFTTFTVTRLEDEDDDTASVPVVALTGRLPEIRRALTATIEEAQQRANDADLIEHARTVGMVEPERAPEFVAAYRAHVEQQSAAHAAPAVPQLADVEEQQRTAEPTHQGPHPEYGHLETHRGRVEDCSGPDCGPDPERACWQTIADALNAANAAGMPVGIDLDGTLTDHNEHSVVWNFEVERWEVAGYDEDEEGEQPSTPAEPKPTPPAHLDQQAGRRAILDSLNTLAHVAIWPHPGDDDMPENTDATTIEVSYGGLGRRATAYALRQVADRLAQLADAVGEPPLDEDSTAAADARNEHLDAGVPQPEQPAMPAVGDRYVKRDEPDAGRIVTVNRVWNPPADDQPAVAYEWPDPRASYAGSACRLDVFRRTYRAEAGR
ncbi:hypothetical protein ACIBVM_18530 [[Kitasatospora] papulosa]|uniref:hypothetical protein n=1 Tax=[Kitasatospora] papulosa TaxID=1464011 RepID=UPI00378AFE63